MEWITDPQALIALLTLTVLEIVLGIDNIIFISILSGKLPKENQKKARLVGIVQILLLDVVFSLDSVITAIGMANDLPVMIIAVIIAVIFMMFFSGSISEFVENHPTIKILALSFLLLIGFSLIVEGLHQHIPKGYIYFAMAFSVFVEMLNLKMRKKKAEPIKLRQEIPGE